MYFFLVDQQLAASSFYPVDVSATLAVVSKKIKLIVKCLHNGRCKNIRIDESVCQKNAVIKIRDTIRMLQTF